MTVAINKIEEVVHAVHAILDANTPNVDRQHFTQALETLKDGTTEQSIPVGFFLIANAESAVAHVGWNVIEHIIKYKWHELTLETKTRMRNGIFEFIASGSSSREAQPTVLTAASRAMVAMMEHEWPEQWPDLFDKFGAVALESQQSAPSQLVFLVQRRLIENVFTLVSVTNNARRRELSSAITEHTPAMIKTAVARIQMSLSAACAGDGSAASTTAATLAKLAMELLSEIFEWASGRALAVGIDELVDALAACLQIEACGIYEVAASCLYKLASRKRVKHDELPVVISIFRDRPMTAILAACSLAASSSNSSELHYKFLKALCDLLCSLGIHLAEVWSHIGNPPDNFGLYLSALAEFFRHPSLYIRIETAQVLNALSTNASISQCPAVVEKMPSILSVIPKSMERIGRFDDVSSPTHQYSRMDYDSEADFLYDFTRLRDRCNRLIRENMRIHFNVLSSIVTSWINERCVQATESIPTHEWESMKRYITCFVQSAEQLNMIDKNVTDGLLTLMDAVFKRLCELNNPDTLNDMLSILSAFFLLIELQPNRLPPILDMLKRLLSLPEVTTKNGDHSQDNWSVVGLKRHCINLLLKVIKTVPNATKSHVNDILNVIVSVAPLVSTMQKANLVHVLAALSNASDNAEEQRALLEAALRDGIEYLAGAEFEMCLTPEGLLRYIGALDVAPPSHEDATRTAYYKNRVNLKSHLSSVEGAFAQVEVRGEGAHPLFHLCLPIIRRIFRLVGCVNQLHNMAVVASLHPSYGKKIVTMSRKEEQNIIYSSSAGLNSEDTPSPAEPEAERDVDTHMRRYVNDIVELTQNCVGHAGARLGRDFYSLSDASELVASAFHSADLLPDFRLRYWIKRAWCRLIGSCPADLADVVASPAALLNQHLCTLLTQRWSTIESFDADDNVTEDELFTQQMVCILSREYASFLSMLVYSSLATTKDDAKKPSIEYITPLSQRLLNNQAVLQPIVASLCLLTNCPDTKTVFKLVPLARVVFGAYYKHFDEATASHVFIYCVRSLQANGSDESCAGPLLGLTFMVYAWLRPLHPNLISILQQVPELSAELLAEFDAKVIAHVQGTNELLEKLKRDLMRKILRPVIALYAHHLQQKLGEQFKRPALLQSSRSIAAKSLQQQQQSQRQEEIEIVP